MQHRANRFDVLSWMAKLEFLVRSNLSAPEITG